MERLAVTFYNADNTPVEKFMFKLAVNQSYGSKVEEADLEFSLRSFLVKLSVSESLTRALSHGNPLKMQFDICIPFYASVFILSVLNYCFFPFGINFNLPLYAKDFSLLG